MSSPFFFEQSMLHYHDELRRNERRTQHLAELRLVERTTSSRLERVDRLIARVPRLQRASSPHDATA